ncbi:hypothetical protein SSS_05849 [Sarcoptes scabiei]|uniref:Chitin-binding type-2 domain-containing protein n=1 Tax=Sarcoptes scabiei TaxID=52283 RepID=A0A834REU0_SARSC|nr:hypothetical protein SSS_05849 [Sarcoptes scabiei]
MMKNSILSTRRSSILARSSPRMANTSKAKCKSSTSYLSMRSSSTSSSSLPLFRLSRLNIIFRNNFNRNFLQTTSSLISTITTTIVWSLLINFLLENDHLNPHQTVVLSWNWQQNISEEILDQFICIRARGFFPHEHRCDHFYECRNGTIINEGICRSGLRFDYRYRKKPRCIPIDQIDCRITHIDLNEIISNTGGSDQTQSYQDSSNSQSSLNSTTATPIIVFDLPTRKPTIFTNRFHPNRHGSTNENQRTTSTVGRFPNSYVAQSDINHSNDRPHRTTIMAKFQTTSSPPSSSSFRHFTSFTATNKFVPIDSNNDSGSPSRFKSSTLAAVTKSSTTTMTTTTSTTTTTTTTTTPSPSTFSDDELQLDDPLNSSNHHQNHNHHHHNDFRHSFEENREQNQDRSELNRNQNIHNSIDQKSEDFLSKERKLIKKPLKLRRGRLQHSFDDLEDDHQQHQQSSSSSSSLNGRQKYPIESKRFETVKPQTQNLVAEEERPPPGITEQILSRAIAPITNQIDHSRSKSLHCPHPNGYYADREDCRKFYACDDGRAFLMSCPLGLAYDEMTGTCSWPDMVEGCRSEEMLRFICPEPNEYEILDYGDPRYPTSDCRKFVVCIQSEIHGQRTPRLLGCEEGLVFNPNTRECDYPENVPACSSYYDGRLRSKSFGRSVSSSRKRKNKF